ncbi:MAG: hypothetical protein AMXMBFR84_08950 [Candidatus Hydrogenedentota bacterium]
MENTLEIRVKGIGEKTSSYFVKCLEELPKEAPYLISFGVPDPYWSKLSSQLKEEAEALTKEVHSVFEEFLSLSTQSALLTDSDRKHARVLVRTILSGLRLRRYQVSAPEIIHDEGTFIAYQEERHSDDTPLSPSEAQKVCEEAIEKLLELTSIIGSSNSSRTASCGTSVLSRLYSHVRSLQHYCDQHPGFTASFSTHVTDLMALMNSANNVTRTEIIDKVSVIDNILARQNVPMPAVALMKELLPDLEKLTEEQFASEVSLMALESRKAVDGSNVPSAINRDTAESPNELERAKRRLFKYRIVVYIVIAFIVVMGILSFTEALNNFIESAQELRARFGASSSGVTSESVDVQLEEELLNTLVRDANALVPDAGGWVKRKVVDVQVTEVGIEFQMVDMGDAYSIDFRNLTEPITVSQRTTTSDWRITFPDGSAKPFVFAFYGSQRMVDEIVDKLDAKLQTLGLSIVTVVPAVPG